MGPIDDRAHTAQTAAYGPVVPPAVVLAGRPFVEIAEEGQYGLLQRLGVRGFSALSGEPRRRLPGERWPIARTRRLAGSSSPCSRPCRAAAPGWQNGRLGLYRGCRPWRDRAPPGAWPRELLKCLGGQPILGAELTHALISGFSEPFPAESLPMIAVGLRRFENALRISEPQRRG